MKRDNSVEEAYIEHKKNASAMVSNPSTEAKLFVEKFLIKKIKAFLCLSVLHFSKYIHHKKSAVCHYSD
jgi:hypothetical protein